MFQSTWKIHTFSGRHVVFMLLQESVDIAGQALRFEAFDGLQSARDGQWNFRKEYENNILLGKMERGRRSEMTTRSRNRCHK